MLLEKRARRKGRIVSVKACVSVRVLVMGPLENNVYLIDDGKACVVVDPTANAERIVEAVGKQRVDAIVLTHAHWDHVGAAAKLRALTGAQAVASAIDAPYINGKKKLDPSHREFDPCPIDRTLKDGDVLEIGSMRWRTLETPGHTPGSICLFLEPRFGSDPSGAPVLVSGDTLFAGAHGRTDFVGGSPAAMRASLAKLAKLPRETLVLPGHNAFTVIEHELPWMSR